MMIEIYVFLNILLKLAFIGSAQQLNEPIGYNVINVFWHHGHFKDGILLFYNVFVQLSAVDRSNWMKIVEYEAIAAII